MLPTSPTLRSRLTAVLPDSLAALSGRPGPLGLPPLRHIVVVLIDGLGASALRSRGGHARMLAPRLDRGSTIDTVFPTTTASALTSLTTGEPPGRHGLVGFSVLDPGRRRVVSHLSGWPDDLDPATWQLRSTVFEGGAGEVDPGIDVVAVGPGRYAGSGFSRAVLRGVRYRSAESIDDRVAAAADVRRSSRRSLVYLYVPELDSLAHRHGLVSGEWVDALERVDRAVADLDRGLGAGEAALVTADHGVIDVPASAHVIVDDDLLADGMLIAGEPRCLQVHVPPGVDVAQTANRWSERYGALADVVDRAGAVEAGLFGTMDTIVLPRIGDFLVIARSRVAFYARDDDKGRGMVGQHGGLTPDEVRVPLIRLGAAA